MSNLGAFLVACVDHPEQMPELLKRDDADYMVNNTYYGIGVSALSMAAIHQPKLVKMILNSGLAEEEMLLSSYKFDGLTFWMKLVKNHPEEAAALVGHKALTSKLLQMKDINGHRASFHAKSPELATALMQMEK